MITKLIIAKKMVTKLIITTTKNDYKINYNKKKKK